MMENIAVTSLNLQQVFIVCMYLHIFYFIKSVVINVLLLICRIQNIYEQELQILKTKIKQPNPLTNVIQNCVKIINIHIKYQIW